MKLYFFAGVLFSLVTAIVAAPAGEDPTDPSALSTAGVTEDFSGVQSFDSVDKKKTTVTLFENGKVEGRIVLNEEGFPIAAYDASGKAIPADLLDADDDDTEGGFQTLAKPSFSQLRKIWKFIKKYGARAARFIKCVGTGIDKICWADIVFCIGTRDPFSCLGGIICGGPKIAQCARKG